MAIVFSGGQVSEGKYASMMSGGGNLRGVPARDSDPLQAFRKEIEKRKKSCKRTVKLRLFPNRYEEETLFDIGLACARLWNELSYEKMYSFFNALKLQQQMEQKILLY